MKFGVWTPLPHTIRPEPGMDRAIAAIKTGASLAGRADGTFEFAYAGPIPENVLHRHLEDIVGSS